MLPLSDVQLWKQLHFSINPSACMQNNPCFQIGWVQVVLEKEYPDSSEEERHFPLTHLKGRKHY